MVVFVNEIVGVCIRLPDFCTGTPNKKPDCKRLDYGLKYGLIRKMRDHENGG
jgi:hypothetical protein